MWRIFATVLTVFVAGNSSAQDAPVYLFGGDGHKEFLGCLNCDSSHPKSVWNEFSQYGFKNDFGVWNPFREFTNEFSSHSMCNEFASDPPVIVDENGNSYGKLTINEFMSGSVCSARGSEKLCRATRAICASKK